jgi:hypothetical protein
MPVRWINLWVGAVPARSQAGMARYSHPGKLVYVDIGADLCEAGAIDS